MDISGPHITPSRMESWDGTPSDSALGFTREQVRVLQEMMPGVAAKLRKLDLPAVYRHKIILERGGHRIIPCPVISCSRDRSRICVIAPNGFEAWVDWKHG